MQEPANFSPAMISLEREYDQLQKAPVPQYSRDLDHKCIVSINPPSFTAKAIRSDWMAFVMHHISKSTVPFSI